MKIVFMGTPDFAVHSLDALIKAGHSLEYVVTQPDRPKNRGKKIQMSPVKERALENNIEVLQPVKIRDDREVIEKIREAKADLIVVVAFGQILPREVLDLGKFGAVNVHGSILPKYRGASPIQSAIFQGEEELGVTIMQMDEGLDTGDIISIATIDGKGITASEAFEKLGELGGKLLVETIKDIEEGTANRIAQDNSLASHCKLISKEEGFLDFSKESAEVLERRVRAYNSWPGTYCYYKGEKMKVLKAKADMTRDGKAGTVVDASKEGIFVAGTSGVLILEEVQLPGKKPTSVDAFLRGHKIQVGTELK